MATVTVFFTYPSVELQLWSPLKVSTCLYPAGIVKCRLLQFAEVHARSRALLMHEQNEKYGLQKESSRHIKSANDSATIDNLHNN